MDNKKVLYRDTDDKILGGVASGLAAFVGYDVTAMRLVFTLCIFLVHGFPLAYILAWIIIPKKNTPPKRFTAMQIFWLLLICLLPVIIIVGLIAFLIIGSIFNPFL